MNPESNAVSWFEIPVLEMERAIKFYVKVGFEFMEMDEETGEIVFMEREL